MRCPFPTSCSIFFFFLRQVTSAPTTTFQWLQCSFEWQWNYNGIGQWYSSTHSGDESKSKIFSHSIILQWLHRIVRWFIPWWACGIPGKDNLFTCTTVYNNWEDSLILISYFNVRSKANLFYTVKSNYRLWYIPLPFAWWDKGVHLLGYLSPPLAMFP